MNAGSIQCYLHCALLLRDEDRKVLWRLSVLCNSVSSWKQKSWGSSPGLDSGLVWFSWSQHFTLSPVLGVESQITLSAQRGGAASTDAKHFHLYLCAWNRTNHSGGVDLLHRWAGTGGAQAIPSALADPGSWGEALTEHPSSPPLSWGMPLLLFQWANSY